MNSIYRRCTGASHELSNKPCQDYAIAIHSDELSMAIVSDGHGGERYFRSDQGSKFLVKITRDCVRSFVDTIAEEGNELFKDKAFTTFCNEKTSDEQLNSEVHKRLNWLFASIISKWNTAVAEHAYNNDLNKWEEEHVEEIYKEEFRAKQKDPCATFEKTYGCTLMAYVHTPSYWFAFHIGDGKLVTLNIKNAKASFCQPVPWDSRCFSNKTTSICDANALEEFRYCFEGDGNFPTAAFLGSDGIDDSYREDKRLYNFYANLFRQIAISKREELERTLDSKLPKISQMGSKDDMSIAVVYDDSNIEEDFYTVADYRRSMIDEDRQLLLDKLSQLDEKIRSFGPEESLDENGTINLGYARSDVEKVTNQLNRLSKLEKQLADEEMRFAKSRKRHTSNSQKQSSKKTLANHKK